MYIQNFKHKTESSRQIQNPRFIIAEILQKTTIGGSKEKEVIVFDEDQAQGKAKCKKMPRKLNDWICLKN